MGEGTQAGMVGDRDAEIPASAHRTLVRRLKATSALHLCAATAFGVGIALAPSAACANPAGAAVTSGSATISSPSSRQTTIDQTSEGVVIDWSSFNIGSSQTTTFDQPNAQAIAINRIGGGAPSRIMGTLDANGRVVLINGNGMVFGKNASVNVGSLIATSTGGSDANLLAGKFTKAGSLSAFIVNYGSLDAAPGGIVALVAPSVTNTGTINAKLGTVALGAANKFTVDFSGDGLVSFAAQGGVNGNAVATNTGSLAGANVSMTARAAEGVATGVVNMGGTITAQSAHQTGGNIVLDAGNGGAIDVSGSLNASGALGGGNIAVGLNGRSLASNITVSQGATLSADATQSGNGGRVQLISANNTQFAGTLSAKGAGADGAGGKAEISSHGTLSFTGFADLAAANGKTGSLLLDPRNYVIDASGAPIANTSVISAATLEIELASADVTIRTANAGIGTGTIDVRDSVTWSSAHDLTLAANSSIYVENGVTISNTGGADVVLEADRLGADNGSVVSFLGTGALSLSGGGSATIFYDPANYDSPVNYSSAVTVAGGGTLTAYMLVNTLTELQAIGADATTRSGDYALGGNIDASATATWNGGAGFVPIGPANEAFTGILDGEDHVISGLTVYQPYGDEVGLFGEFGGEIIDLTLSGGSMNGYANVGAFAGFDYGQISHSSSSAGVVGFTDAGGLAGYLDSGSINRSYSTGAVSASTIPDAETGGGIGGLVGYNAGTISYSYATGQVFATDNGGWTDMGGLTGSTTEIVEYSYATGKVTGDAEVGGLTGYNGGNITDSYATGNVVGTNQVGGLMGENAQYTVSRDYASGSVSGYGEYIGGFVGQDYGLIRNSFETGSVSGVGGIGVGGFVGDMLYRNDGPSIVTDTISLSYESGAVTNGYAFAGIETGGPATFLDVYWDTNNNVGLSGDPSGAAAIVGLTTADFQTSLPNGFNGALWGTGVLATNNGLPYLLAIPPA